MSPMSKAWVLVGATSVASAAFGGAIGYFVAFKKIEKKYDELLRDQIAEAKKFYAVAATQQADKPASPIEALETAIAEESNTFIEAVTAVQNYQSVALKPEVVPAYQNPFKRPEIPKEQLGRERREEGMPVIITEEEFNQSEFEFDQVSLTYYAGDDILADDKDQEMDPSSRNQLVGDHNLSAFADPDRTIMYVRNLRHKTDFEIARSDGEYAKEVAGFR